MADKIDMNQCKRIIRKNFKLMGSKANNFLYDLLLTSMGIKSSLLFDYACGNGEKLVKLLEELKECNHVFDRLSVVVLGCDVFIADVDKLLPLLKEHLKDESFNTIDVTGQLGEPCSLAAKTQRQICGHFTDLISQIEQKNHKYSRRCDIDAKNDWNLCTMFGFLLCYPVIYWFDTEIEHNCLSLIPLALYQAKVSCKDLNKKFIQSNGSDDDKMFISFSCPESLLSSHFERHIDRWSKRVKRMAEIGGVTAHIHKSIVTLQQVAL